VCKILVGNKCDGDRKVALEDGKRLAMKFNMQFIETSAKNNYNVRETFTYLIKNLYYNYYYISI